MSLLVFANNALTYLAGPIAATATSANLAAGSGINFPQLQAGQYFVMTFNDQATKQLREIVWVTAISGDTITIVRGQEGTAALSWLAGDIAANWWTAGQAAAMIQVAQLQIQATNFAMDTGAANSLTISLVPAPTTLASIKGSAVRLVVANTNTGASTLNINALGATTITNPDGTTIQNGQLIAGHVYEFSYNGSTFDLLSSPYQLLKSANTWNALQLFAGGAMVPNNVSIQSKDTAGNPRSMVWIGSDNNLHVQSGPSGLAITNSAGTGNAVYIDTVGDVATSGGVTAAGFNGGGYQVSFQSTTYTSGWRQDNANSYFLIGLTGQAFGNLRPLTIANTGYVTIDGTGVGTTIGGSAVVNGNLAVPNGTVSAAEVTATESFVSTGWDGVGWQFRADYGGYNQGFRNDGTNTYIGGSAYGGTAIIRYPFLFNNATGAVTIDAQGAGVTMSGGLSVAGNVSAGYEVTAVTIQSNGGPVTANGNRLRAAYGATGSGDQNAAAILADFAIYATSPGYQYLPSGLMMQWWQIGLPMNGTPALYNFPWAFAHAALFIICNYMGNLPPVNGNVGAQLNTNYNYLAVDTSIGGGEHGTNFFALGY